MTPGSTGGPTASGNGRSSSRTSRSTSRTRSVSAGPATLTGDDADLDAVGADVSRASGSTGERTVAKKSSSTVGGPKGKAAQRTPRRIRLTLARLDPFSVMKLSFLVAIAFGIATIVATVLIWSVLDGMGVWDDLNSLVSGLTSDGSVPAFMKMFSLGNMASYATIVSFLNLVIITALGTLFAFLYNIVAGLLGGLKMTFTDD